jgi:flagellar biogenesis protein FliO
MDSIEASKAFFALLFVLLLVLLVGFLFKKFSYNYFAKFTKGNFKLGSVIPLDTKRRIVSIEFENIKYTMLLGQTDILLDKKDVKKSK